MSTVNSSASCSGSEENSAGVVLAVLAIVCIGCDDIVLRVTAVMWELGEIAAKKHDGPRQTRGQTIRRVVNKPSIYQPLINHFQQVTQKKCSLSLPSLLTHMNLSDLVPLLGEKHCLSMPSTL